MMICKFTFVYSVARVSPAGVLTRRN